MRGVGTVPFCLGSELGDVCAVASALFCAAEQSFFMGGDLVSLGHLGYTNGHIFLGASSSQMGLVPFYQATWGGGSVRSSPSVAFPESLRMSAWSQ